MPHESGHSESQFMDESDSHVPDQSSSRNVGFILPSWPAQTEPTLEDLVRLSLYGLACQYYLPKLFVAIYWFITDTILEERMDMCGLATVIFAGTLCGSVAAMLIVYDYTCRKHGRGLREGVGLLPVTRKVTLLSIG